MMAVALVGAVIAGCDQVDDLLREIGKHRGGGGDDGGGPDAGGTPVTCRATASPGSWTAIPSGTTVDVRSVWAAAPSDAWAVAAESFGTLLRWNGTAWTPADPPPAELRLARVWGASRDAVLVSGRHYSLWNGTSWSDVTPPTSALGGALLWGLAADDVWSQIDGAVSHWNGTVWTPTPAASGLQLFARGVWGSAANDVWLVGEYAASTPFSAIQHWDGTAWTAVLGFPGAIGTVRSEDGVIFGVWGTSASDVWAAGASAAGPIWHFDGSSWSHVATPPLSGVLNAVWGACPNDVWAVGERPPVNQGGVVSSGGVLWHFDGQSWSEVSISGLPPLFAVEGTGPDDVWIGGLDGTIYHHGIH
jgi:hypothetical protein